MTWDNVSLANGYIRVRRRADFRGVLVDSEIQGRKERYSARPHGSECREGLAARLPTPPWRLCVSKWRRRNSVEQPVYKSVWFPLLRATGLMDYRKSARGNQVEAPRYTFHRLRHTAASLFIEQGWTPKKVMTVMGHSSIQMTFDLYGHLWKTLEDDAKAVAQIEERLFS